MISLLFSAFYLAVVLVRAAALAEFLEPEEPIQVFSNSAKDYSILVALYHEAGEVEQLVKSLKALRWQGRKSIYLICEADDHETRAAIRAQVLPRNCHLVIVPDGKPKTKPRALTYCLQFVSGDYLVIYDAEDRPHPDQLLEAAAGFESSPEELACLQAPLTIDNANESFLTRMFAIEYKTLFFGILPALAKWKSPIPLGGTSNHFRLHCLRKCGGWDAFNVTEDADLGIRLARFGYHCGTITLPTYEEAPRKYSSWLKQRTRWIKGWMQTLLVHMRDPLRTLEDMGWRKFVMFHMVLTSVVVSVLVHPFFLVAFVFQIWRYFSSIPASPYDIGMTAMSTFNLVAGYTTYGFLAWVIAGNGNYKITTGWVLLFPVYWLLISLAGWRAIIQLLFRPHLWEKTDHGSMERQTPEN